MNRGISYSILTRRMITYNNDHQRRCYNGCHFSVDHYWSSWEIIEFNIPKSKIINRLIFWRDLNDYAVSQRGESARAEFKMERTI